MVIIKKSNFIFILFSVILLNCEVDLLGIFGSVDLDKRLEAADEFHFIKNEWHSLKTSDDYYFIVLSDTHITGSNTNEFEKLKSRINNAKFIVVTGDITQSGTAEEINAFISDSNNFGIPVFPVIGNHDIYLGNWDNWRTKIGSTRYRIDTDTATLIVLDSANALFGESQLNWFERQLADSKNKIFIFSHTNLFADEKPSLAQQQFTDTRERAKFISLLNDKCKAYFSGHIHQRIITNIKNTTFITQEDWKENKNFCRVHVTPNGFSYTFENL